MHLPLVEAAALNNALWCDAVCRAQGLPTHMDAALWRCAQPTPRYYPNAVTLDPLAHSAQVAQIGALVHDGMMRAMAVKDSFATLDLSVLGFQVMFDATWIARAPRAPTVEHGAQASQGAWRWAAVRTPVELAAWESAWCQGEDAPDTATFAPALLQDPNIFILAAQRGGALVGGGILYRTATLYGAVVGISNTFACSDDDARACWLALADAAARFAPDCPLVGYEAGNELAWAMDACFTALGPLRVWARSPES